MDVEIGRSGKILNYITLLSPGMVVSTIIVWQALLSWYGFAGCPHDKFCELALGTLTSSIDVGILLLTKKLKESI